MTDSQPTSTPPRRRSSLGRLTTFRNSVIQRVDSDQQVNDDRKLEFRVQPEKVRFYAYLFFWSMVALAMLLTNFVVAPILLEGPTDGKSCPPFETGEGFDVNTNSHLIRIFGYNNASAFSTEYFSFA